MNEQLEVVVVADIAVVSRGKARSNVVKDWEGVFCCDVPAFKMGWAGGIGKRPSRGKGLEDS